MPGNRSFRINLIIWNSNFAVVQVFLRNNYTELNGIPKVNGKNQEINRRHRKTQETKSKAGKKGSATYILFKNHTKRKNCCINIFHFYIFRMLLFLWNIENNLRALQRKETLYTIQYSNKSFVFLHCQICITFWTIIRNNTTFIVKYLFNLSSLTNNSSLCN